MLEITRVLPGSTAARYGLQRGDRLVSVNGGEINDSIDFLFHASDERLSLVITSKQGVFRTLRIVKDPDDTLGVEFPPLSIRRCHNKCIFCFVDQMPPGCRRRAAGQKATVKGARSARAGSMPGARWCGSPPSNN